jgi:hypothetical protein
MLQSGSSFGVQMRCSNFLFGVRAFKGNTVSHRLQFTALLMSCDLAEIGLLTFHDGQTITFQTEKSNRIT